MSTKVQIVRGVATAPVEMYQRDIPVGTYFWGRIDTGYTNLMRLYLRAYAGIVDLEHPGTTWDKCSDNAILVRDYRPLKGIDLVPVELE